MNLSPEKKIAGVLVPLFALRGEDDLGIGDTGALREFIDWAAEIGFKLVQLLPINEVGADNSPYNAISAMAIEPTTLHLAPGSPAELTQDDFDLIVARFMVTKLRSGAVHYDKVRKLKRALLEQAFSRFQPNESFLHFREREKSWLDDYVFFRALMEENGGSEAYDFWPEEQRAKDSARSWLESQSDEVRQRFTRHEEFFRYVQWIAYAQWMSVKAYADERGVALMGDIPFGVSYY